MTRRAAAGDVWTKASKNIAFSSAGRVATHDSVDAEWRGVRGEEQMTTGVHYWEVTMTADPGGYRYVYIGVSKPDLNLEAQNGATMNTWYLRGTNGALYGNGKVREDEQGKIQVGDRIGVLLDLRPGKGTLAFYLNGTAYGSGFTSGVQGPVVRAVEMYEGAVLLDTDAPQPESAPTPAPTPGPTPGPTPVPLPPTGSWRPCVAVGVASPDASVCEGVCAYVLAGCFVSFVTHYAQCYLPLYLIQSKATRLVLPDQLIKLASYQSGSYKRLVSGKSVLRFA